jgi:membrane-bound lytic murein transglycosylase B
MNVLKNRLTALCSGFATRGFLVAGLLLSVFAVSAQTASFDTCVKGLRQSVVSQGIQGAVFDRAMKGVEPDPDVLKAFSFLP